MLGSGCSRDAEPDIWWPSDRHPDLGRTRCRREPGREVSVVLQLGHGPSHRIVEAKIRAALVSAVRPSSRQAIQIKAKSAAILHSLIGHTSDSSPTNWPG